MYTFPQPKVFTPERRYGGHWNSSESCEQNVYLRQKLLQSIADPLSCEQALSKVQTNVSVPYSSWEFKGPSYPITRHYDSIRTYDPRASTSYQHSLQLSAFKKLGSIGGLKEWKIPLEDKRDWSTALEQHFLLTITAM